MEYHERSINNLLFQMIIFLFFIYLFSSTGVRQEHADQYVETLQNLQQLP